MITRVIINLVQNGAKYSKPGSDISVQTLNRSESILVRVVNTNAEIDDYDIKHLFEPFYRVEKSRNRDSR